MEINDMLYKHIYNVRAKISEKQEEIIMQTIQEIGGETFYEITFDRDKVIEALTMYKNKADYVEVKHGEWIAYNKTMFGSDYCCSLCGNIADEDNHGNFTILTKYCSDCGAKMKGVKK